jgi:tetratricopeptide (TPR) repeat protein
MKNTARTLGSELQAKVVGRVELKDATSVENNAGPETADGFLNGGLDTGISTTLLLREVERLVAEMDELQAACRWQEIVDLCHPVEEKCADLVDAGLEGRVRLKLSFALCRAGRHEDAIACLLPLTAAEPDNSLANYNIGYAVVDLFYRSRTERKLVPVRKRAELLELAHRHFERAIVLRPESVTFCYRYGILLKEIEKKSRLAIPQLRQAVENWEQMDEEQRQRYHQMKPKYIKAMYHLASCLLEAGRAGESRQLLQRVLEEDRDRNHMQPLFKHFAMGKILAELADPQAALDNLETALHSAEQGQPVDFVHELMGRLYFRMKQPEKGLHCIGHVPERARRPYVRWTEAFLLSALGRQEEAMRLLRKTAERDRRAAHVALIQLCRIALGVGQVRRGMESVDEAMRFYSRTYTNPCREAMFWKAVCHFRLGEMSAALELVKELEHVNFRYPHFNRLAMMVRSSLSDGVGARER